MPRPKSPVRPEELDPAVCSLEYRLKIIGRLPFFRHLSSEAIGAVNRLFEDRDVPAEKAIYFEGDPGEHLYLVAMGKVKLMRNTASGREVVLDILQISAQKFEQVLSLHPDVTLKVLKAVGQRLEESQEIVKQLSVYSVDQRMAAALVRLATKLGEQKQEGVLIQLPFSRQDLAAMTGATIETVSRVMSRLSGNGLVSIGRKWVVINDLESLEQIAKEGAVN